MSYPRLDDKGDSPAAPSWGRMNRKTTSIVLVFSLLGLAALLAPPAAAHVCAFEYGPTCSDAPCDNTGTHVHWGNRLVPCFSTRPIQSSPAPLDRVLP